MPRESQVSPQRSQRSQRKHSFERRGREGTQRNADKGNHRVDLRDHRGSTVSERRGRGGTQRKAQRGKHRTCDSPRTPATSAFKPSPSLTLRFPAVLAVTALGNFLHSASTESANHTIQFMRSLVVAYCKISQEISPCG